MKAIVSARYGPAASTLRFEDVDQPTIAEGELLVRVAAASVNALDWRMGNGKPYVMRPQVGLRKPKTAVRGVDVAGIVEAVGAQVTQFKPGDAVFGVASGAFAEQAAADEKEVILKPDGLSFEHAAAMPIAGCTALKAVRDTGQLRAGQSVLINGAAGGVGSFAVQIAKALGGRVTGVCRTDNVELVRSLGADDVIDYTTEDFARRGTKYDLIIDIVGNRSLSDLRRALSPRGTLVLVGGGGGNLLGPLTQMLKAVLLRRFVKAKIAITMGKVDQSCLRDLTDLYETGRVIPVIERTYTLAETPEALAVLETGHGRGKLAIVVES